MEEDVITFLENSNFDDFTIIRYIYIYVCKKFSYDTRFYFASDSLKEEIYNKRIDISNVEDFEIVCYSFAHILVDLLSLFNIYAEIVFDSGSGYRHSYVIVKHQGKVLKLDPTKRHDISRVKMHNGTLDFTSLINDPIFFEQLKDADKQIAEKTNEDIDFTVYYNKETLISLYNAINKSAMYRNVSRDNLFFEKIDVIRCLINTRFDFTRYDDIDYYLSYLIKKFNVNDGQFFVKPIILFKNDDPTMRDIINIIVIEYHDYPPIFYLLEKDDKNYNMREIDHREVQEKMQQYSNITIEHIYKRIIDKALGKCK